MKHRLLSLVVTLALMAGFLSAVVAEAPPASATPTPVQPRKIAVIVLENQSSGTSTACTTGGGSPSFWNSPYLCSLIANNSNQGGQPDIAYTQAVASSPGGTYYVGASYMAFNAFETSAPNYAAMVAGDDCHGLATDGYFNKSGGQTGNPLTEGSTDNCGANLFKVLDDNGVSWANYAEDFSSGTQGGKSAVTCTDSFSDGALGGSSGSEYVRRHNPGTFYEDVNPVAGGGDCFTGGDTGNVLDWPGYNANLSDTQYDHRAVCVDANTNNVCDSDAGMVDSNGQWPFYQTALPAFSFIVPNNCHDEHTGASDSHGNPACVSTSGTIWDAWGVYDSPADGGTNAGQLFTSCNTWATHKCTSSNKAKVLAADTMLAHIVPNIQADLGPTGVLVITWDEGSDCGSPPCARSTSNNQIGALILPGTGATLTNAGTAPSNKTDQAGLLAAVIHAFNANYSASITCAALDPGTVADGDAACTDAENGNSFNDIAGTSSMVPIGLSVTAAPSGLTASPTHAFVGDPVTISGTDVGYATSVSFNGTSASFTVNPDGTSLSTTVPVGATTGAISVTNAQGTGNTSSFTVDVSAPFLVQKDATIDTGNNTSPTGSLPSSATSGNTVVAAISFVGTGTVTARPTGFSQAVVSSTGSETGKVEIDYCTTCTGTSFTGWTISASARWTVEMLEYANAPTLDQTALYTSGNSSVTTINSGTTSATANANEAVVGVFYNASTEHAGSLTAGFTEEAWSLGGSSYAHGVVDKIVTSTGTQNASETLVGAVKARGVIATFQPAVSAPPPALVQKDATIDTGSSSSPSGSLPAAVTAGSTVVATISCSGTCTVTARPTGFSAVSTVANMEIDVCTSCSGQSSFASWTISTSQRWAVEALEYSNITGAVDAANSSTSGSSTSTTISSGSITTSHNNAVIVAGLYNLSAEHGGSLTAGFTEQAFGTFGSTFENSIVDQIVSSTGTYQAQETLSTAVKVRGAIVALF